MTNTKPTKKILLDNISALRSNHKQVLYCLDRLDSIPVSQIPSMIAIARGFKEFDEPSYDWMEEYINDLDIVEEPKPDREDIHDDSIDILRSLLKPVLDNYNDGETSYNVYTCIDKIEWMLKNKE